MPSGARQARNDGWGCNRTDLHAHLSAVWIPVRRGDAHRCLRLFLRMYSLPRTDQTVARRLLRVLFLWDGRLSASAAGGRVLPLLSAR